MVLMYGMSYGKWVVMPKGIDSFKFSYSKKIDLDKNTDERAQPHPYSPWPFTLNWPTPYLPPTLNLLQFNGLLYPPLGYLLLCMSLYLQ